ncbi:hypothetical protein [Acidaminococcus sp.]|uniref:hypothetical protein n=1 Tax=Acidaminococcus sp. TaxID=1872103 RepID=UPI003D7E8744
MIGIYCTTIYHLLVAISLTQNDFKNQEVILFVSPHFVDNKKIINNLNSNIGKKLFKKIVILNDYFGTKRYAIERKIRFFFFYRKAIDLCKKYTFKKFIFFPGNLIIASLFAKYISKYSHDCEFGFGDDGLASYINHDEYTMLSESQNQISNLLNYNQYLQMYKTLYVMEPDLVVDNKKFILKHINHPDLKNNGFKELIKKIFTKGMIPKCDILYLQQPFIYDSKKLACFEDTQTKSISKICNICKDKKLYIKIHPRTPKSYSIPSKVLKVNGTDIFEASISSDINDTVLITLFSTAAFTPFMFWGYTPKIILLYQIANQSINSSRLNKFIKKFKIVYSRYGGRIYEPNNWNQLEKYLKVL